jgi:hypothetical protein
MALIIVERCFEPASNIGGLSYVVFFSRRSDTNIITKPEASAGSAHCRI